MHNFLYSLTLCLLHYYPRHVSSISMPVFRRKNCIHTASDIFALCKRLHSALVKSGLFRASTCPSSGRKIVFTQHLVSSLSVNVCTVHWLRADWLTSLCRVHATRPPTQSDSYQRLYWHNLSLLMMSTICSKHVCLFVFGTTAPSGPGLPHSRGF